MAAGVENGLGIYLGSRFRTWAVLCFTVLVFSGFLSGADAARGAVVVLDPGHGGMDPGAVDETSGILEKTINLEVAQRMRVGLTAHGHTVLMTRERDDVFCNAAGDGRVKRWISLDERATLANRNAADIFVSIHANSFHDRTCAGTEVFYHHASEEGRLLARAFQTALRDARPSVECRAKPSRYYVLRATDMPALLVEMGYITNDAEAKLLMDPAYQEKLAAAFTAAVNQYLKRKAVSTQSNNIR